MIVRERVEKSEKSGKFRWYLDDVDHGRNLCYSTRRYRTPELARKDWIRIRRELRRPVLTWIGLAFGIGVLIGFVF